MEIISPTAETAEEVTELTFVSPTGLQQSLILRDGDEFRIGNDVMIVQFAARGALPKEMHVFRLHNLFFHTVRTLTLRKREFVPPETVNRVIAEPTSKAPLPQDEQDRWSLRVGRSE